MNGGGVQLATVFSPNLVNEVRGGVINASPTIDHRAACRLQTAAINVTGVTNIGYNPLGDTSGNDKRADGR